MRYYWYFLQSIDLISERIVFIFKIKLLPLEKLTDNDYWHFLISFGKNASTYKPAWGKVLANLGRKNSDRQVLLSELAENLFDSYNTRTLNNPLPQMGQRGKKTIIEHKLDEFRLGRIAKSRQSKRSQTMSE